MSFLLPAWTLCRRDLIRFWRERARVAAYAASPIFFWFVIGSGFGDLSVFFPGALTMTVLFAAIFSTMSIIEDRNEGFLLSMLVSPAPRLSLVVGKLLGGATMAWVQSLILLAFTAVAKYQTGNLLAVAGMLWLIAFSFTALGFIIAWGMNSSAGYHAMMNLVLFPMWMLSGVLFSPSKALPWMKALMSVNPMTYAYSAVWQLLDPKADQYAPIATCAAVTAGFGILLIVLSAWIVSRPSKRTAG